MGRGELRAAFDEFGGGGEGEGGEAGEATCEEDVAERSGGGGVWGEEGEGAVVGDEEEGVEGAVAEEGGGGACEEGFEEGGWGAGGGGVWEGWWGCGWGGLEADFEDVEGVADDDADGAGEVAGPEVGGHFWE